MARWLLCVLLASCGDDVGAGAPDAAPPTGDGPMMSSHDAPGAADAAPALADCPCFSGNGLYCATAISDYGATHNCAAPNLAQHTGDLYQCNGGAWSVATVCAADGCLVAPAGTADRCKSRSLWVVFGPGAIQRDLEGLFHCLLERTDFNDRARGYTGGYGLTWGAAITASCAQNDYNCAVGALRAAGRQIADHDVVEIIVHGYCGGDNNARGDGVVVGGVRVRGANVGDCPNAPAVEERVAVHEAFEACGDWANADCCTGEVNTSCPDQGESFCPSCPCSCGRYASDGTYGGEMLDCGGGHVYFSQRVPSSAAQEFNPDACNPFTLR